ncbi:chorismate mutase [Aquibacillus sp. 3ASR75-11]|uniref:chorismate mutase n=1 Tax=Terrihalobacillus insolitus TaxID=2950438 RepID=A0A9X3WV48_9BACI|nr:chorismate mutase [Terrihalobacillus insolitus]MDC3424791.1 chorismate mutase [Terrihalobacillus insolitus]
MMRGIRGATTVDRNESSEIISHTKELIDAMVQENELSPPNIASVFISVTNDINADFPAKALRLLDGWKFVPVMCMQEINVPGSLAKCIRVMITANTERNQEDVVHIYHYQAKKLRPDLIREEERNG